MDIQHAQYLKGRAEIDISAILEKLEEETKCRVYKVNYEVTEEIDGIGRARIVSRELTIDLHL
jgi:hypothetical protein